LVNLGGTEKNLEFIPRRRSVFGKQSRTPQSGKKQ
jgi:hypothetical protein